MISIIIPTYNEEKYIGDTLAKLKSLSIPHEIIVTDDKSTDNTVEIARQYTDKVLVPEIKHKTIGANRAVGVRASSGEFLVFMDSTCYMNNPNDFFTHVLEDFKLEPRLVALTVKLRVTPELETLMDRIMYFIFNTTHYIKNNILHTGEAAGKFQMIKSSAFDKIGGINVNLVTREDADLFVRLAKIGLTKYDSRLTVYHSGRRAHAIGWIKLLYIWMINTFWVAVFGTSKSKNWERWWEKDSSLIKKIKI